MAWNRGPRYQGWDIALNHSAFVELDGAGKLVWYNVVVDAPKQVQGKSATLMRVEHNVEAPDKQLWQLRRLNWWAGHIKAILDARHPTYIAIEDYAIHATGNSAYQIGELGGVIRNSILNWSLPVDEAVRLTGHPSPTPPKLRLHDPMSVKMYLAHQGNAHPETVAKAVEERWPETLQWTDWHEIPRLDLAVAYGVAQMVLAEVQLRSGEKKISDFHEKEIQVFNRVTKAYPVNLLSRPWFTL